jgi:putative aldouronate transport system permease protein
MNKVEKLKTLESRGEKVFRLFSLVVMGLATVAALLPFALIIIASFTAETSLIAKGYSFMPLQWSTDAYGYMMQQAKVIFRAYGISILTTTAGTAMSLVLTTMMAYPMSRPDFKYRNLYALVVFFTMLFSGGIVPSYIMWTRVFHINNTIWALLIPNYLMGAFNVLLVRNYFTNNIPYEITESAQMDGAGDLRILFRIMLPLSVPVNVTVGLFAGLAYWNDWTNALYYVDTPKLFGIQNLLMRIMNNIQFLSSAQGQAVTSGQLIALPSNGIRMALTVIGILPILVSFPFLQKYLIHGVVVGAVKG